jgi:hypothetical protein
MATALQNFSRKNAEQSRVSALEGII